MPHLNGSSILITGGTGSLGKALVRTLLARHSPKRVVVYSRDELKQHEMAKQKPFDDARLRYFIGDVRDAERLKRAFEGIDYVIHAAALKQVPACEYNPFEAVKTNVLGAQNIIEAAIDKGVRRVVALSTDKACSPVNLYGATKLCSDKLFIAGNAYSAAKGTRFAVVRYGNVMGSRGSVIPYFAELLKSGAKELPITHKDMTRFWIKLEEGVRLVLTALETTHGGELYVPKIPSMKVTDLAKAIAPDLPLKEVGIRPGEKIHEMLISREDARESLDMGDHYIIQPSFDWWGAKDTPYHGTKVPADFEYSSDKNSLWVTVPQMRRLLKELSPS